MFLEASAMTGEDRAVEKRALRRTSGDTAPPARLIAPKAQAAPRTPSVQPFALGRAVATAARPSPPRTLAPTRRGRRRVLPQGGAGGHVAHRERAGGPKHDGGHPDWDGYQRRRQWQEVRRMHLLISARCLRKWEVILAQGSRLRGRLGQRWAGLKCMPECGRTGKGRRRRACSRDGALRSRGEAGMCAKREGARGARGARIDDPGRAGLC